jgi:hypothetical protein
MPPSYNHFQNAQEEFWKAVLESFEESDITDFRTFFIPLFFIPEDVSVHSSEHPINKYGRNVSISTNMDALRSTITEDFDVDSCPDNLLEYMFEEEDHDIYEALAEMIRKYKELGNYLRNDDSSDSD